MRTFLLTVIFGCFILGAQAQFRIGVVGGMDVSSINFNKDLFKDGSTTGFQIGAMSEYMIRNKNFGVDLSVLISKRGFEQKNKHYSQTYLDVPINVKYKFKMVPFVKPYVAAGPYVSWVLGDKTWTSIPAIAANSQNSARVTPVDCEFGVNIGAGVEFLKYFHVGVNYGYGITDAHKVYHSGVYSYAQNRNFAITAGFLF